MDTELLVKSTALSDGFALLALMTEYPTIELSEGLVEGLVAQDVRSVLSEAGIECPVALGELDQVVGRSAESVFGEMRCEYTRLFNHPEHPAVPLYEGQFLFEQGLSPELVQVMRESDRSDVPVRPRLFVNPASIDATREYRQAGMAQQDDRRMPADAMPIQMNFVSQLYKRLARSEIVADGEGVERVKNEILEFTHYHLAKWMKGFYSALLAQSRIPVYRAVGALGVALADDVCGL